MDVKKIVGLTLAVALTASCAAQVKHREMSEEEVGLGGLQESNIKKTIYSPSIQNYVSKYAIFADVINQDIIPNTKGYLDAYNVYDRDKLTYPETGLQEVDPFLLRAYRLTSTIRVGTRLMNFIGLRLKNIETKQQVKKDSKEIYYTMTPEDVSLAVLRIRELKGTLDERQKRELAKDIVALAADMEVISVSSEQANTLLAEGNLLKQRLASPEYTTELQRKDPGRAKLLPEIISNVNGAIAGLSKANGDGASIVRNARMWELYLADSMQ